MNTNYITPNWPAPKNIQAFTTTRTGSGISKPPYDSFNLGIHTGDNKRDVLANRGHLIKELYLPNQPIWLKQEHTNTVIELTANEILASEEPIADASFTKQSNIICAVLTADCLPILLCNTKGTIVAAIHAGWRGIASRIIEETIKAIISTTSINPKELLAWLGPAIGPDAFEINKEIAEIFINNDLLAKDAFIYNKDRLFANIYLLAKQRLNKMGINMIYGEKYCTFSQKETFFSYRRDKNNSGRMASIIWIDNNT